MYYCGTVSPFGGYVIGRVPSLGAPQKMAKPFLGLRVVRGPDWCSGDQDGEEGCVGTVVEVGEGGTSAMVQWDLGTSAWYRCGRDHKFDLRVFDAAPTGEICVCRLYVVLRPD